MGPGDFSPWKPRGSGKRDDVEWGAVENDRGVFQNNYFVFQNGRFSVFKETMLSEVLSKMTVVCSKITILCSKMTDFSVFQHDRFSVFQNDRSTHLFYDMKIPSIYKHDSKYAFPPHIKPWFLGNA